CLKKRKAERFGSAEELLAALEQLRLGPSTPSAGEPESPFTGLSAFQEADSPRFYGRESEVAGIISRLRHQPLVVVAGPGGAGRSSLVRAGVVPALKRAEEQWETFVLRPGRRPLAALTDVLDQITAVSWESGPPSTSPASGLDRSMGLLRTQPGLLGAR